MLSAFKMSILLILLFFRKSKKISSISYPASKNILPVFSSIMSDEMKKPNNDSSLIVTDEIFFFLRSFIIF